MSRQKKKDLFSLLREVNSALGRGPRQGISVRPGQNKVLKILNGRGDMRQQDLLAEINIRPASLSELLQKLEKDDYITRRRNEKNKSEIIVSITGKGQIIALENELSMKERDETLFSGLEIEEKRELDRILNKLLDLWGRDSDEETGKRRELKWKENEKLLEEKRQKGKTFARAQNQRRSQQGFEE